MLRRGLICERATEDAIDRAAQVIRAGGLAAFPTETVYGLGADAFNPSAVAQIYRMKGRPNDNPLILHVATPDAVAALAELDERTAKLMAAFWPGPLTLVLRKKTSLPEWVGGHPDRTTDTVAIRLPGHPVARALIERAGCVIAAPSANKAGTPSPTCAAHVAADFTEKSLFLLDDGDVPGGLESTVLDMTGGSGEGGKSDKIPVILRPGAVTADMLSAALGVPVTTDAFFAPVMDDKTNAPVHVAPRSPGMKYRHYAPRAPMMLVTGEPERAVAYIVGCLTQKDSGQAADAFGVNDAPTASDVPAVPAASDVPAVPAVSDVPAVPAERRALTEEPVPASPTPRYGILATTQTASLYTARFGPRIGADICLLTVGDREAPDTIARNLYACLRRFDALGVTMIYAEGVAETGLGAAIMNRMKKAAGGRIV